MAGRALVASGSRSVGWSAMPTNRAQARPIGASETRHARRSIQSLSWAAATTAHSGVQAASTASVGINRHEVTAVTTKPISVTAASRPIPGRRLLSSNAANNSRPSTGWIAPTLNRATRYKLWMTLRSVCNGSLRANGRISGGDSSRQIWSAG